jgi:hypothetical protein
MARGAAAAEASLLIDGHVKTLNCEVEQLFGVGAAERSGRS